MLETSRPSVRAANDNAIRCLSTGSASATTSSIEGARRPSISALRANCKHQGLTGTRSGTPRNHPARGALCIWTRSRGANKSQNGFHDFIRHRDLTNQSLRGHQLLSRKNRLQAMAIRTRRLQQHPPLRREIRIGDVDLQKKPVQLRLRQWVCAFLLKRILRRKNVEWPGHIIALAGYRYVMLLHGLQQRRLGLGRRTVDLVCHEKLGEYRALE